MGALDLAMNVITLGGHARLKVAKQNYEIACGQYKMLHTTAVSLQTEMQRDIEIIGNVVKKSFEVVRKCCKLLRTAELAAISRSNHDYPSTTYCETAPKASAALSKYSAAFSIAKGAGAATTATVGSWALVSLVGAASTGTSIAGLTGVAATNATLAWFGGGALAAGGAGMAGGAMVIGGLIAAPLIIVSAWSSHSKAGEIDKEQLKVDEAAHELSRAIPELRAALLIVAAHKSRLSEGYDVVYADFRKVRRSLYPWGPVSWIWRHLRRVFGVPFFSADDSEFIDTLTESLERFAENFKVAASSGCKSQRITVPQTWTP